jgi:hypothetical protein
VVVVVVLGAVGVATVPPGSPGHQLWTRVVGTGSGQTDPQVAAIQQVIPLANDEQAQALAMNDPSVMSDTATAAYYRQLVQTNQNLLASGVTSIRLTNLAWGPITVNGTTATATTRLIPTSTRSCSRTAPG